VVVGTWVGGLLLVGAAALSLGAAIFAKTKGKK